MSDTWSTTQRLADALSSIDGLVEHVSKILDTLAPTIELFEQLNKQNCRNRFALASAFLCLSIWTLQGESSTELINKLTLIRNIIGDIDCANCPSDDRPTNPANQPAPDCQAN